MDDYIKREDALKWCRPEEWGTPDERWRPESEFGEMIKALPAADVAERELDEWCYDCKEYDSNKHNCPRFRRVIRDTVDECKAINVERKKGKWIDKPDPYGFFDTIPVCSECGCTTKYREKTSFCPHCGTDMREVDE